MYYIWEKLSLKKAGNYMNLLKREKVQSYILPRGRGLKHNICFTLTIQGNTTDM